MNETWKAIPNYQGLYEASDFGRIKSLDRIISTSKITTPKRERILKPSTYCKYDRVVLSKDQVHTTHTIHSLVAMAFLNHIPNGHKIIVDHINNIPKDNRLVNLQLISQRENCIKDNPNKRQVTGVGISGEKFTSAKRIDGVMTHFGTFDTIEEAHNAYLTGIKKQKMEIKKFTQTVRDIIRHNKELRAVIAGQLGIESATVYGYIATKKENPLTKRPVVIDIIKKFTGLKESEIIDKSKN